MTGAEIIIGDDAKRDKILSLWEVGKKRVRFFRRAREEILTFSLLTISKS